VILVHGSISDYRLNLEDMKIYYPAFQDVNVMIVVGFGFLMSVLRNHQFSAAGYTFLITAISYELHPILTSLFHSLFNF
jgi:hypothetical protein